MKRLYACFSFAALVLILTSCATGLTFTDVQPSVTPKSPNAGRIFFYRPSALGAALRPEVLVNGEKVGEAISWGFFYVDRPPGEYEVITTTEVKRKVSFILAPNQTRFIRFSTGVGFFVGHVYGELVDNDVGLSEIKGCKYTGSNL